MNVPVIQNNLQVGVGNGRVVLGIDKKPIAMFSVEESIMLASLLLKHASLLMANPAKVDVREDVPDETLCSPSMPSPENDN